MRIKIYQCERETQGRFARGNRFGLATRFQHGRSGNPRGRPIAVQTWLCDLHQHQYTHEQLHKIITDPNAHRNLAWAARLELTAQTIKQPVEGVAPERGKAFYRQFRNKSYEHLVHIFTDQEERPERREGARQRLYYCWH